jgi:hypothetical protein
MAAGAVPGAQRIRQEWELWGSAHLVESSLLWARAHAIATNDSLIFIIDQNGSRFYWIEPGGTRYEDSVHYLPAGIRIIQSPQKSLRFYQHGNAVPAGTFVLQGPPGTYRVIVNMMGRVRVLRP